jgi:hypothetical protein
MTRYQRSRRSSWAIVAAIAVLVTGWHSATAQPVDLLLTNGKVYVGGAPAYEDAVAVKGRTSPIPVSHNLMRVAIHRYQAYSRGNVSLMNLTYSPSFTAA